MTKPAHRRYAPSVWITTALGIGLITPAPGTVGALLGVPLAWFILSGPAPLAAWAALAMLITAGVPLCGAAARRLADSDPKPVIWDEIVTLPLVFALTPYAHGWWLAGGFVLHRVFDIAKPWPCNTLQDLHGGWGIMGDDLAAAAYAAVVLRLAWFLFGA